MYTHTHIKQLVLGVCMPQYMSEGQRISLLKPPTGVPETELCLYISGLVAGALPTMNQPSLLLKELLSF